MVSKQRLLVVGCGFLLPFTLVGGASAATPEIRSVEGALEKGEHLVLEGTNFSNKSNARPYFIWEADRGTAPREISRNPEWSGSLNGELSSKITAPNSKQAFRFDHGSSSGAALAGVEFQSDELFVFRKTYEDFDTSEDFAIRTRVENLTGEIQEGQTVHGTESGATGVVQKVSGDGDRWSVYYLNTGGSINQDNPVDFEYGEEMTTDTATFKNSEGSSKYPTGTYRTFNFKTFRMWNDSQGNNLYVGTGRSKKYDVMPEYTDGKLWNGSMETSLRQRPREWKSEEAYYKTSGIGTEDGILDYRFDNTQYYDARFTMRDSERPDRYDIVYQSQVSNGAQPNSHIYYDHLYIDDSWHHVAVCNEKMWSDCKDKSLQIPLEWSSDSIKVEFNPRHLDVNDDLYIYVVDGQGEVNAEGFNLCSDCPNSPRGFTVE